MQKISAWFRRTFQNCYGVDQLNLAILVFDLILCFAGLFIRNGWLSLFAYIPMGLVLFRMLSRNKTKRYQENRRFLQLLDRLKDRNNRYFRCPKCRQTVRVPRGKGKSPLHVPGARKNSSK